MVISVNLLPTPARQREWAERYDLLERITRNGWLLIPATAMAKNEDYAWGNVNKHTYSFRRLFGYNPCEINCSMLMEDIACSVDFDCHKNKKGVVQHPNGVDLFQWLLKHKPGMFVNAIIEVTISGGVHVYFKGINGSKYIVPFNIDGTIIKVEVLCGRALSFCYPTRTKDGMYKVISQCNFENTKPLQLPRLPKMFQRPVAKKISSRRKHHSTVNVNLTFEEKELALNYYMHVHEFMAGEDNRHDSARPLARYLFGIGLNAEAVAKFCKAYIEQHGRELSDKNETVRLAEWASKKPLRLTASACEYIKMHKGV